MTMLGRGKKKAAKDDKDKTVEAPEAAETTEEAQAAAVSSEDSVTEPQEAPEPSTTDTETPSPPASVDSESASEEPDDSEDSEDDDSAEAQARLIAAKAELAKAEAELAKARLAEAEAELARAEKAAKQREKAREKGKAPSYRVTTIEPGPAAEDDVPAPSRDGEPTRPPALIALAALTAVLFVACAVIGGLLWKKHSDQSATEAAAREATTAAAAAAQDFSSYDYRSLDSNFKTGENEATGQWLKNYKQLTDQIRQTAQQTQVVVVGTVLKTGIEQVTPSHAVAIVFLNQQTSKAGQDKGYDQYRLRLTMEKHGGHWLVSNLQAL